MFDKIFEIIKDNLKNPRLYIVLLVLVMVFLLLFPYIDANFFYYNRVEKRIAILKEIASIDKEKVEKDIILKAEYDNILDEISKQKEGSLGSVFITNNTKKISLYKFITGGLLAWIVGILCIFIKMDSNVKKILGFLIFVVIGGILGSISTLIPTIISPKCNYILMPILELIFLGILITSTKKD